jgi:Family of unknown function (DUF6152)
MQPLSNLYALGAVAALAFAPCAGAHHSVAAYDRAHLITLAGTVQRFRYMNPHVRISLHVVDGRDGDRTWELEGGTIAAVTRDGVTVHTLQPGQRIRLLVAPRKDGTDGGEWQRLLEVDGRPFLPVK